MHTIKMRPYNLYRMEEKNCYEMYFQMWQQIFTSSKSKPMSSSPSLPSMAMSTAVWLILAEAGSSPNACKFLASSVVYL